MRIGLLLITMAMFAVMICLPAYGEPAQNGMADSEIGVFDFDTRTVLLNSGYRMPILGLGTYALDHNTCVSSVKALLANGGRLIDTAYMYGNEEAVGEGVRQAVQEYGIPREDIFVITKIYLSKDFDSSGSDRTAFRSF